MLTKLANFPDDRARCPTNLTGFLSETPVAPPPVRMIKQAPSIGRILTMVAFALSCFGILIFLWLSFGGSVPLQPEGYRVNVAFPEATQLAQEAEVRISGVKVGKVRKVEPERGDRAHRRGGGDRRPLRADLQGRAGDAAPEDAARARPTSSSLPAASAAGTRTRWPDGGSLPRGQVADTVQLDEILRTFDPETRERFSTWLDQQGRAATGNGEAISDALGNLTPFAENTDDVLKVLRAQSGATRRLVRNTGEVFSALSERRGQLRGLIRNSNRVWETTARRDAQLADTFRVLPTFLREGRTTTRRLTAFAEDTDPLIDQLRPAARELSPTLQDLDKLSPDLRSLLRNFGPLVQVSQARASRRPPRRSTTRGRSSGGSTPSCASSRRSSTTSASTSARSRPSSRTTRRSPRPRRATSRATCAPRTR